MKSKMTPSSKSPVRNLQCPPSMTWRWGVPDTLLFMLESRNLAHKSWITYCDYPWCQEWPHPPSIQSGTINILQVCVWTSEDGGFLTHSPHAREPELGTQVNNHISGWYMMSRTTPSSKHPVSNPQHPPSTTSRTWGPRQTSNHATEPKFGTQVKNYTSCPWQSMIVKDDPIFQVSSKETSTSSKHGLRGWGALEALLIIVFDLCT